MAVLPIASTTGDPISRAQINSINVIKRFTRVGADAGVKLNNGERVVNPGDDALAFTASRRIRSDISALKVVTETGQLNATGLSIAINGLDLMKVQLDRVKKSLVQAQSATADERALIQTEIDLALAQIDSISSNTKLGNRGLLNGESTIRAFSYVSLNGSTFDFTNRTTGNPISTVEGINEVRVNRLGVGGGAIKTLQDGRKVLCLVVSVAQATRGSRASIAVTAGGAAGDFSVFRVTGKYGSAILRIDSTTASLHGIAGASAFNALAEQTGVVLTSGGNGLAFVSLGATNDDFVKVEIVDGNGAGALAGGQQTVGTTVADTGKSTVVRINGQQVFASGDLGQTAHYQRNGFDLEIEFDSFAFWDNTAGDFVQVVNVDLSQGITGVLGTTGASGDTVQYGFGTFNTATLGKGEQRALLVSDLGGTYGATNNEIAVGQRYIGINAVADIGSGGGLSLVSGNIAQALKTIDRGIDQLVAEQARLGIIQSSFLSSISNAETAIGNLSAADADIIGVDAATEITNLIQAQLGISTASSVLSQANAIQANIFSLLRG